MVRRRLARTTGSDGWDDQEYIRTKLIPGQRRYVFPQRNRSGVVILDGTLPVSQLATITVGLMEPT